MRLSHADQGLPMMTGRSPGTLATTVIGFTDFCRDLGLLAGLSAGM